MIEQQGKVVAIEGSRVRVRLGGTSACSACDAGKGCGAGVFGRLLRRKPVVMGFENQLQAARGQAVMVGLPESLFMSLVLRLYLLPVLAGIVGAAIGHYTAGQLQASGAVTDLMALATGLVLAFLVASRNRRLDTEFPQLSAVHLLRIIESTDCKT